MPKTMGKTLRDHVVSAFLRMLVSDFRAVFAEIL